MFVDLPIMATNIAEMPIESGAGKIDLLIRSLED
jgi:hypothetical protein